MPTTKRSAEFKRRFKRVAYTQKWAVTETKVRIRQAVAKTPFPHWHLLTFTGAHGSESRGVVDMIAIRKDHSEPPKGAKRGDLLQVVLIQVKGGHAAKPTAEDAKRLRIVARRHGACGIILATWRKGKAAKFYALHGKEDWTEVSDPRTVFASQIPFGGLPPP